jgi:hypothetical protein
VLVERAFGQIVARRLAEYQHKHNLSDVATAGLARVKQPYWTRVRNGLAEREPPPGARAGERLISALAVSMPDLLHGAIDEVQVLKSAEIERLRASSGEAVGAPT